MTILWVFVRLRQLFCQISNIHIINHSYDFIYPAPLILSLNGRLRLGNLTFDSLELLSYIRNLLTYSSIMGDYGYGEYPYLCTPLKEGLEKYLTERRKLNVLCTEKEITKEKPLIWFNPHRNGSKSLLFDHFLTISSLVG